MMSAQVTYPAAPRVSHFEFSGRTWPALRGDSNAATTADREGWIAWPRVRPPAGVSGCRLAALAVSRARADRPCRADVAAPWHRYSPLAAAACARVMAAVTRCTATPARRRPPRPGRARGGPRSAGAPQDRQRYPSRARMRALVRPHPLGIARPQLAGWSGQGWCGGSRARCRPPSVGSAPCYSAPRRLLVSSGCAAGARSARAGAKGLAAGRPAGSRWAPGAAGPRSPGRRGHATVDGRRVRGHGDDDGQRLRPGDGHDVLAQHPRRRRGHGLDRGEVGAPRGQKNPVRGGVIGAARWPARRAPTARLAGARCQAARAAALPNSPPPAAPL